MEDPAHFLSLPLRGLGAKAWSPGGEGDLPHPLRLCCIGVLLLITLVYTGHLLAANHSLAYYILTATPCH